MQIPFIITIAWLHIKDFLPRIRPLLIKNNVYDKIYNWIDTKMGRKLLLLYIVLILATLGAFIPPLLIWILTMCTGKPIQSFSILGSTEWVTMVSLLVTSYMGINHLEKRVALRSGIPTDQLDNVVAAIKGSPKSQKPLDKSDNE